MNVFDFIFISAATIGFEQTMYTANEGDGTVEIAVALLQGSLSRPVEVHLYTMDGSARSELGIYILTRKHLKSCHSNCRSRRLRPSEHHPNI